MFHVKHSELTATVIGQYGLKASAEQLELLDRYLEMVLEWNAKINLISRRDEENIVGQHLLHSLAPLFVLSMPEELMVMDLGSGGGFPGIPLAILKPGWTVVLVDSIRKKTLALEDMVARLALGSVRVVTGRVEEKDVLAPMRGKFDLILARGVASLTKLADLVQAVCPAQCGEHAAVCVVQEGESPGSIYCRYCSATRAGDLDGGAQGGADQGGREAVRPC